MDHETRACPECGEAVPLGRLSCPHCGGVLAAVAGRYLAEPARSIATWGRGAATEPGEPWLAPADPDEWDAPSGTPPSADEVVEVMPAPTEAVAPAAEPAPPPAAGTAHDASAAADPDAPVEPAHVAPAPTATAPMATPSVLGPVGQPDQGPAWYEDETGAGHGLAAAAADEPPPAWRVSSPSSAPGAWVPPAPAASAASAASALGAPPAPFQARPWVGQHGATEPSRGLPATPPPAASLLAPTATGSAAGLALPGGRVPAIPSAGRALPSIDGMRVDDAAGWLVLAGSMATAIGFLVPWSRVIIGARSAGGYTDTWGLAGPGHALVFLAAILVFALAAVRNPIGPWLRTGVAGLVLGSVVLGLIWPYLLGPLGAGPGVLLLAVAALLLIGGGLTSAVIHRHAAAPPPV